MIKIEDVQDKVLQLRNENVIIDSDVAALYGVQTKEINQAVKTIYTNSQKDMFFG